LFPNTKIGEIFQLPNIVYNIYAQCFGSFY
jgi:hypothetical protein